MFLPTYESVSSNCQPEGGGIEGASVVTGIKKIYNIISCNIT